MGRPPKYVDCEVCGEKTTSTQARYGKGLCAACYGSAAPATIRRACLECGKSMSRGWWHKSQGNCRACTKTRGAAPTNGRACGTCGAWERIEMPPRPGAPPDGAQYGACRSERLLMRILERAMHTHETMPACHFFIEGGES